MYGGWAGSSCQSHILPIPPADVCTYPLESSRSSEELEFGMRIMADPVYILVSGSTAYFPDPANICACSVANFPYIDAGFIHTTRFVYSSVWSRLRSEQLQHLSFNGPEYIGVEGYSLRTSYFLSVNVMCGVLFIEFKGRWFGHSDSFGQSIIIVYLSFPPSTTHRRCIQRCIQALLDWQTAPRYICSRGIHRGQWCRDDVGLVLTAAIKSRISTHTLPEAESQQ